MSWIKDTHVSTTSIASQKKKQRQFIGLILMVIGYFLWSKNQNYTTSIAISFVFLCTMLFLPKLIQPVLYLWIFLGKIISEISSTIVLSILFFGGIFPIKVLRSKPKNSTGWISPKNTTNFDEQF